MNAIATQTKPYEFPSVIRDLPFETYLEIEALNSHGITTIVEESLYHFKFERENPKPPGAAMAAGTLIHEVLLEPEKNGYRVLPPGGAKNSKAGLGLLLNAYCDWLQTEPPESNETAEAKRLKDQVNQLEKRFKETDLYTVTQDQIDVAERIRKNVFRENQIAKDLFADGSPEVTLLWEGLHNCKKKARVDWLPDAHEIILDAKSIDRASYTACEKAIRNFNYDYQAAWYTEGGMATGFGERTFVILFLERVAPYHSRFFHFSRDDLQKASRRNDRASALYAEALSTDQWPAYPKTIDPIFMSKYRYG